MSGESSKPKLSFGFKGAALPATRPTPPPLKKAAAVFEADDDEDHNRSDDGDLALQQDNARQGTSSRNGNKSSKASTRLDLMGLAPGKSATPASKADKKKQEEAVELDASVFDYDSVYDSMKEAEKKMKMEKQAANVSKKPKYVDGILESAEIRKRDRLRAEARMIQKQREAEGDEFEGKEAFVTNAYKEQQAELAKAEEKESKGEAEQREKSGGMASFYRDMLNESSSVREAAIAASLRPKASSEATDEVTSADKRDAAYPTSLGSTDTNDLDLARQARERGLHVELNDEGQVVDKRDLLTKGLNIISKKQKNGADAKGAEAADTKESRRERRRKRQEEYESRMNRDAQRSRQSALIEEQMLELERKRKAEEERQREEERSKVNAKRNDSASVLNAKQRYLERKRQRMEQTPQGQS